MSTPIKATRRWITRRMDTDQQSPLEGTPTLWPTQYGPHDEEVFVIKASDLKAIRAQVQDVLLGGTGEGETTKLFIPSGLANQRRREARHVMESLGLIPTPPRRKERTR